MAVNKPVRDNARKGAVKKRTQLKTQEGRSVYGRQEGARRSLRTSAKRSDGQAYSRFRCNQRCYFHWVVGVGDFALGFN